MLKNLVAVFTFILGLNNVLSDDINDISRFGVLTPLGVEYISFNIDLESL